MLVMFETRKKCRNDEKKNNEKEARRNEEESEFWKQQEGRNWLVPDECSQSRNHHSQLCSQKKLSIRRKTRHNSKQEADRVMRLRHFTHSLSLRVLPSVFSGCFLSCFWFSVSVHCCLSTLSTLHLLPKKVSGFSSFRVLLFNFLCSSRTHAFHSFFFQSIHVELCRLSPTPSPCSVHRLLDLLVSTNVFWDMDQGALSNAIATANGSWLVNAKVRWKKKWERRPASCCRS